MDIEQWVQRTRDMVDNWIIDERTTQTITPGSIEEAMFYSLTAGGKRLRPQLILASGAYVGCGEESLRHVCLAVEYLHTYSLIHDDLPAMDDDDLRRGVPTAHKAFGEALAILAGDALLTEAFYQMTLSSEEFPPNNVVQAIKVMAEAGGRDGMIRGQVEDIAAEDDPGIAVAQLEQIHRRKTGALFEASLVLPAILSGNRAIVWRLRKFGQHFGLAFQIVDDILNVIGDSHLLGKATGTDNKLGKATYPSLLGIEESSKLAHWHKEQAIRAVADDGDADILLYLMDFAINRQW